MTYRSALALVAAVVTGCGSDGSIALESAPAAYAAAYCDRMLACCGTAELEAMLGTGVIDRASCESFIERVFGNEFIDDTRRAIDLRQATYDGAAMSACLEHLLTDACPHLARPFRLMTLPVECAPVRIPRVPDGGECDHDFQCTSGACASGDHESGRCEAVPAIGSPCPMGDCGSAGYCDRSRAIPVCAPINPDGGVCASSLGCESLQCIAGTCMAPAACDGR